MPNPLAHPFFTHQLTHTDKYMLMPCFTALRSVFAVRKGRYRLFGTLFHIILCAKIITSFLHYCFSTSSVIRCFLRSSPAGMFSFLRT